MGKDCYFYNFRLNLKNPRHAEIAKRLGSLNKKVFKSKSDFLIRAVEHYIACMDSGDMSIPDHSRYVTEDEIKKMLEQAKKDIRLELYEDMIKILAGGTVVVNNAGIAPAQAGQGAAEQSKELDLTQFGDIMRDIENWSSN